MLMMQDFIQISLIPILIGALVALCCALPGNFLLLRRQSLMSDAISHVILPGIIIAFLLTGSVTTWPMMLGAGGAALIAVLAIEAIKRFGKIESGAAMGVIFTAFFAAGVLLLEQSDTSGVHLDVEHALYGNLESLIWLSGQGWYSFFDRQALAGLSPELWRMAVMSLIMVVCVILFWRPLAISTFDESFAATIGLPVRIIAFALVMMAAVSAVAAFDAVGSIIVIAMFICPPAAARLMTNDLKFQVILSVMLGMFSAIFGYVLAGYGPLWFGFDHALSAAGMMAAIAGVILGLACIFGRFRKPSLPK
jgi:manganese/zinc/iron transport system permease protein